MSTIILWNDIKKQHEKWVVGRDGIKITKIEKEQEK